MWTTFARKIDWIAAACLLAVPSAAHACGISWNEPRSFFENVDFQGHVHIVEKIGALDIAEKHRPLPIYLIFNSSYGASPYTGAFEVPILESKIVQTGEDTFLLRSPSGWLLPFVRNKEKTILSGPVGMKGEIKGDQITVWTDCGDRLLYRRGRIAEIQKKDVKLIYVYSGDLVSQIQDSGGKSLLSVKIDPRSGKVAELLIGSGESIKFGWGTRPIVHNLQGRNLIGATQDAVATIALTNGDTKEIEFAVDANIRPSIRMNDGAKIYWNAATLLVEEADGWTYQVKPSGQALGKADIGRKNREGRVEFWYHDPARGLQSEQRSNGIFKKVERYSSGILAGKIRSMENQTPKGQEIKRMVYDETGKRIRMVSSVDGVTTFEHDKQGRETLARKGDHILWKKTYAPDGSLATSADFISNTTVTVIQRDDPKFNEILKASPPWFSNSLSGIVSRAEIRNEQGITRTIFLDERGRIVAEEKNGIRNVLERDLYGRTQRLIQNGALRLEIQRDATGRAINEVFYSADGAVKNLNNDSSSSEKIQEAIDQKN